LFEGRSSETVIVAIRTLNETLVGYGYSHVSRVNTTLEHTYWTKVRLLRQRNDGSQVECGTVDAMPFRGGRADRAQAEVTLLLRGYGS
jgi:hypothetical protein